MTFQEAGYTAIATPTHLRAGETIEKPITILHDDPLFDCPSTLGLTATEARALAFHLLALADAA